MKFEDAIKILGAEGIVHDVIIGESEGSLMTREGWLEDVEDGGFIDYDGMGDQVSVSGEILDAPWIYPSTASELLPETKYILWYNR